MSNLTLDQQPAKGHQKHQQMFFEKAQAISPAGVHIGVIRLKKSAGEHMQSKEGIESALKRFR
jgi:hypothetical protein